MTCVFLFNFFEIIYVSDIDECESNPCIHGDCEDLVNGYECICDVGVTGERCDECMY